MRGGGGLVVEATGRLGQAAGNDALWPVQSDRRVLVFKKWNLTITPDASTAGVLPTQFAPPVYYGNLPWETLVPQPKKNAKILVTSNGLPLIVRSPLGAGQVVWSGLNLPYHTAAYANGAEAKLFAQLIATTASRRPEQASGDARYIDPQHIDVTATNSRGVLVKENLAPDWTARVDGHAAKIYRAGLDFMWIPLDGSGTHHVTLVYRRAAEQLGELITVITLLVLVLGAVGLRIPSAVRKRSARLYDRGRQMFSST